jgi:DNA-binding response OmpR family regulator
METPWVTIAPAMVDSETSRKCGSALEAVGILAIEDQPEVLNLKLRVLSRAGCDVVGAQTDAERLRLARHGEFDRTALDMDLTEANVFGRCSRVKLKSHRRQTSVLFVS